MDIQRKAFESSNNVNPDWSFKFDEELQQYVATDFEMTNQVDEFNEHWDTFRAGWEANAQAVQEGLIDQLESTANFMRGMCFDPRLHHAIREAVLNRVEQIEAEIEAQEPTND